MFYGEIRKFIPYVQQCCHFFLSVVHEGRLLQICMPLLLGAV